MNRKSYILILLFLQWPLFNLYRLWGAAPRVELRPYLFCREVQSYQWHLRFLGDSVGYGLLLLAIWLYITANYKRDRDVLTVLGAVVINQFLDIFHYIGFNRHSEWLVFVQGFVMLFAGLILLDRQLKQKYGQKR